MAQGKLARSLVPSCAGRIEPTRWRGGWPWSNDWQRQPEVFKPGGGLVWAWGIEARGGELGNTT